VQKTRSPKTVLLVDDQPEFLQWVIEFLERLGFKVHTVKTYPEAVEALRPTDHELILVDMEIPARNALPPDMVKRAPLVEKYPGIGVAIRARTVGYGANKVIGYTVHDDDAAAKELEKLGCRYVLKGRPGEFKDLMRELTGRRG